MSGLQIELTTDPVVNMAMQQNDVPVVKHLRLANNDDKEFKDVTITLTCDPEFFSGWKTRIAAIPPGKSCDISRVDLQLSPGFLAGINERLSGIIKADVLAGDVTVSSIANKIDVLSYDEWSGFRSLPEILAAFVQPNHPIVEIILNETATVLGEATGDSSLSGYQAKNRGRVFKTVAALYSVISGKGINYVNPPASFEQAGQKIRFPDRIIENKLGTCLDLSVLFAACLEQCGLNPLVLFTEGHAFVGVWLIDDCFADSLVDDLLRVRKRVDLNEICVVETTLATQKPHCAFEFAADAARRKLGDGEKFTGAIDIRRARKGMIRPVPIRTDGKVVNAQEEMAGTTGESRIELPDIDAPSAPVHTTTASPIPETPATRLDRWKRKLLDLSLRNKLINFKDSQKTLRILCPDLPALEDSLAEGEIFRVHPKPKDLGDTDPRDPESFRGRTGKDALGEFLKEELQSRRLHSSVEQGELNKRLIEIYRAARNGIEEGGASVLYLALGFLSWCESEDCERKQLAPIILIPVVLERQSVQEGFKIRRGDEEPQVNITLLELLEKEYEIAIPGMNPPPSDAHGIDVKGILDTFRQKVVDIKGWEVVERAHLGLFSFSKYLMWLDLNNRADDLKKSKVVNHLVENANESYPGSHEFPDAESLDSLYKPEYTFCPLDSDSSQMAAIHAAAEGRSFVLHGPPGTGKSQTITNLIAHCLASGKSVLFVSEKMAALRVVHSRLSQIGLEPFCLELHSNKTEKLEVIRQLGEALDSTDGRTSGEWEKDAFKLERLRHSLNEYVHALHKIMPIGMSVFQATSKLVGLRDAKRIPFTWKSSHNLDAAALEAMNDAVNRMRVAGDACGGPCGHPLSEVQLSEWNPGVQNEIEGILLKFKDICCELQASLDITAPKLGLEPGKWDLPSFEFLSQLVAFLLEAPDVSGTLLVEREWKELKGNIAECVAHGRKRDALRTELFTRYESSVLDADVDGLFRAAADADLKWAPIAWYMKFRIRKIMKRHMKPGIPPPAAGKLRSELERIRVLHQETKTVGDTKDMVKNALGRFWNGGEVDWAAVERQVEWCEKARKYAAAASGGDQVKEFELKTKWALIEDQNNDTLRKDEPLGRMFRKYLESHTAFKVAKKEIEGKLKLDEVRSWPQAEEPPTLDDVLKQSSKWLSGINGLRMWVNWGKSRKAAIEAMLSPIVSAYETGGLTTEELEQSFKRSVLQWWVETSTNETPCLREFFSPEHERMIKDFREIDIRYMRLAVSEIRAKLAAKIPRPGGKVNDTSEIGILKRQLQKQRAHMPVRKLFQNLPTLLPLLKPCLLMSPMSVAQYLDPAHPQFDLVIFDEASQIPVWDAVGAIARGKEAVIVGDPEQLPPTNFFNKTDDQESDDDEIAEDMESILDDCLACRLPQTALLWHYRSKHESLITFSNREYYRGRLLTFPSPDKNAGVTFRHIANGIYDKSKSRTNRAEAEAVVAEIVCILTRHEGGRKPSVGVVTFSLSQQTLIENLLEEVRGNPSIDAYFSSDSQEPVFVKNLENVQGDERDIILISVCYGPDEQGRISHNFGPLNRDGGHRRLNVAVTRARHGIIIFSSMLPEQINLAQTRARGAKDLKRYLDYARRGVAAFADENGFNPAADFDSPLEQEVCDCLRGLGYDVHLQIGCSGYRIDLGVVDPENPGSYIIGVECDGANYHRSKTARDRDRLRESMLRSLGWNIHRIWSTDWWHSKEKALEKLEAAIKKALEDKKSKKMIESREEPPPPSPQAHIMPIACGEAVKEPEKPLSCAVEQPQVYKPFTKTDMAQHPELFYSPAANISMRSVLAEIVALEGPVAFDLAAKRLATYYGLQQLNNSVRKRVLEIWRQTGIPKITKNGKDFLWPTGCSPIDYDKFRIPGEEERSRREPEDIPPEEVANAVIRILREQVGISKDSLVTETARLLGYQRTGPSVRKSIVAGIAHVVSTGKAVELEDRININTKIPGDPQ